METHSPSLPPLHSGDKKIRPSSYQNSLLQGMNNIDFLFMGDTHIRHNIVYFCLCAQLVCREAGFAPVTPPPTGRLCARPVGGGPVRRLLYCHCRFVRLCPAAGRFGRATRSFSLLIGNFHRPVSLEDVNTRGFSCKDTFSFSLRSPSLSISSSSLDPCILYYELVLPSMNLECAVLKLHSIAYN